VKKKEKLIAKLSMPPLVASIEVDGFRPDIRIPIYEELSMSDILSEALPTNIRTIPVLIFVLERQISNTIAFYRFVKLDRS
jgi:hypothetical protein